MSAEAAGMAETAMGSGGMGMGGMWCRMPASRASCIVLNATSAASAQARIAAAVLLPSSSLSSVKGCQIGPRAHAA